MLAELKILSVRVPEHQARDLRLWSLQRGIPIQTAVQRAIDLLLAEDDDRAGPTSRKSLRGSLKGTDVLGLRKREKEAELAKDRASW